MGFLGSYSKTFGQIYIADDAFLAAAATVQNFVNGGGRILWGFIYDYLGYRVKLLNLIHSGSNLMIFFSIP